MESGLMITHIKSSVDEKALRNYFGKFGNITYLSLVSDKFNSNNKVCYLNYNSLDSAKRAVEEADKSTIFGNEMRMSYKKISNSKSVNGNTSLSISRTQCVGRGRGIAKDLSRHNSIISPVMLRYFDIPMNTKILVEIVELNNLNTILARPIKQTEQSKQDLNENLITVNEQINSLGDVRILEIDGYYLAKWEEDNKYYRAKLLEKLGNNKYKVCFVDEGTSGDIVTELREIPKDLSEFPCQFIPCDMECEENAELIDLIIKSGESSLVSIYVTSRELNSGKYRINLFIDDNDVIELCKKEFHKDPRKKPFPAESSLKKHKVQSEFTNFQVIDFPKHRKDLFRIVLTDSFENNPKVEPIESSPVPGDLLIYRQTDNYLHRSVIESLMFKENRIAYKIRLLDENRTVNTPIESLLKTNDNCLFAAPRLLNCLLDVKCELSSPGDVNGKLIIENYDAQKDVYVINIIKPELPKEIENQPIGVIVSHVESCSEFYVQYVDEQSMHDLQEIQSFLNDSYRASKLLIRDLNLNQMVVAPYLGEYYRAFVKEIDPAKARVQVFFIDYGNSEWIKSVETILQASEDIKHVRPFAYKCKLPVMIKPICLNQADELLRDYIGEGEIEMSMKIMTEEKNILTVDLFAKNKSSFVDILQFKKLVINIDSSQPSNEYDRSKLITIIQNLEKRISSLEAIFQK